MELLGFEFMEDMKGYVSFSQTNYQDGYDQGRARTARS